MRSASRVEPPTRAMRGTPPAPVPNWDAAGGGGGWACRRVQTSAKSWPSTAAGSTSSRVVMAWGLTRNGAPQQAFARQDLLSLGDGPAPAATSNSHNRHDDGQRQESGACG